MFVGGNIATTAHMLAQSTIVDFVGQHGHFGASPECAIDA